MRRGCSIRSDDYPAKGIALFVRAETRVNVIENIDLVNQIDWPDFVVTYRIRVVPPRWNGMMKHPKAAREHIEAPNRMTWSKTE